MNNIDLKTIHRICINCCGLFGDVLIRTPFIEKVAELFPNAKITVIVDQGREGLLTTHPNVQKILSFNRRKKPWWSYTKNWLQLVWHLRRARFDIFFNLYGGGSSASLTGMSGARYRFGFYYKNSHRRFYTHAYPMPKFATHWGQEFGYLLQEFGIVPTDLRAGTTFVLTAGAQAQAEKLLSVSDKPWVLVNLGAGDPRKMWSVARHVALAQWLVDTYEVHIGVFINPGQEYLTVEFERLAKEQGFVAYSVLNVSAFDVMAALLARAKFLISGDTGMMHLAFGVKCSVLILFTYTRPELVLPDDCVVAACFVESKHERDAFGRPMGDQNVPLEMVQEHVKILLNKTG